jgi:predicted transcriptional regulator
MSLSPVPRVGYGDAMRAVMSELANGSPMSISTLSKKLNIDRRTIANVIDLLLDVQDVLVTKSIETKRTGRRFIIKFQNRASETRRRLESALQVVRRRTKRT